MALVLTAALFGFGLWRAAHGGLARLRSPGKLSLRGLSDLEPTLEFRIRREFESWDRIELHLAPQIANPRDPDTGRARKWSLGPWVFRGLGLLAKLKFLRCTPFDPFGWTAHRRRERELIREYEQTLAGLLASLSPATHPVAVEIASIPEQIRGFDLVKDEHLAAARDRQAELLGRLSSIASGTSAPAGA